LLTFRSAWNAYKSAAQYRPARGIAPFLHQTRRGGRREGGEVCHLEPNGSGTPGEIAGLACLLDAHEVRPACAVGTGARTQQAPEAAVECGQVAESCFERDAGDRVAGAAQADGGALQTHVQQELVRRHSSNGAKGSQEVKGTHRDFGRQLLQRQRLITLRLHSAQDFCDTPLVAMARRVGELFSPSRWADLRQGSSYRGNQRQCQLLKRRSVNAIPSSCCIGNNRYQVRKRWQIRQRERNLARARQLRYNRFDKLRAETERETSIADTVFVSTLEAVSVIPQQGCAWREHGGSLSRTVRERAAGHDRDAHSVVLFFEWPVAGAGSTANVVYAPTPP
jgi:hypothetical protein